MTDDQLRDLNKEVMQKSDTWLTRLVHSLMIGTALIGLLWMVAMWLERHATLCGTPNP